jgi:hypothetical protein
LNQVQGFGFVDVAPGQVTHVGHATVEGIISAFRKSFVLPHCHFSRSLATFESLYHAEVGIPGPGSAIGKHISIAQQIMTELCLISRKSASCFTKQRQIALPLLSQTLQEPRAATMAATKDSANQDLLTFQRQDDPALQA